jgi:ATP-dependent Zn protease
LSGVLFSILPLLLIIGAWVFFIRVMNRSGNAQGEPRAERDE